jgi:hypothetical protein
MKIKKVSREEFEALWEKCKGSLMIRGGIDPVLKGMTVIGKSGKGTEFKDEYDRMLYELYNPPIPMHIDWYEVDGITRYEVE